MILNLLTNLYPDTTFGLTSKAVTVAAFDKQREERRTNFLIRFCHENL